MRRTVLRIALACALIISPIGATVATASHTSAHAQVLIYHPANTVVGGPYFGNANCTDTTCTVSVGMSGRERSQFNRWCGRDFAITVATGETTGTRRQCFGTGTWLIEVDGWLLATAHGASVTIRVVPVRP